MPEIRKKPQHKRHGHHQKRSTKFLRVYHPFLPLLLIISGILLIASVVGSGGLNLSYGNQRKDTASNNGQLALDPDLANNGESKVLAYATNISDSGLLSSTNQRRGAAGVQKLKINSQLSKAAQAKANDMAKRNYWAHNTPDGSPPWVFISDAGYSYSKAGENLACGFDKSQDVITGWYNSPSHKANLLHKDYQDVGFGIANADNYNCGKLAPGKQTIIVAMYGQPYSSSRSNKSISSGSTKSTSSSKSSSSSAASKAIATHNLTIQVTNTEGEPIKGVKVTVHSDPYYGVTDTKGQVVFKELPTGQHTLILEAAGLKTESPLDLTNVSKDYKLTVLEPSSAVNQTYNGQKVSGTSQKPKSVSRLELMTNGNNRWVLAFLLFSAAIGAFYVVAKHSLAVHRFLIKGDRYIHKHKLVDLAVVILIIALYILTRSVGIIL